MVTWQCPRDVRALQADAVGRRVEAVGADHGEAVLAVDWLGEEGVVGRVAEERGDRVRSGQRLRTSRAPRRLRDGQQLGRRQSGAGHQGVEQQLVGGSRIPAGVIAGDVHWVLRLLADEAPLLPRGEPWLPKPENKILVRSELSLADPQLHHLTED